jgi:predicted NBD/HSP70 family sugar kinase
MQKATRQQIKSHNSTLVLRTIFEHAVISRATVSRVTNLSRATVSDVVAELLEEGLVAEVGQGISDGGKPPTLLSIVDDSLHLICIDAAGEEQLQGAVINLRGQIRRRHFLPLANGRGDGALEVLYQLIADLLAMAERPVLGIGVGAPGLVDTGQGRVVYAVNLEWYDVPLAALLRKRFDLPVHVANDANAAALGEFIFGSHAASRRHRDRKSNGHAEPVGAGTELQPSAPSNVVVLLAGRGIRAGIVMHGGLHLGDYFGAGEIGHLVVEPGGQRCVCGNDGCLETVASTVALQRRAQVTLPRAPAMAGAAAAAGEPWTTDELLALHGGGDSSVAALVAQSGAAIGIAAASLVTVLNVERIVVAGSLARFGEGLLGPLRVAMAQRALPLLADRTTVTLSELGADIVILGTAALLLNQELGLV